MQWGLLLSFVANLDSLHNTHWDRVSECCGMESHPVWPQSSGCGECMGQGECSVGGMACIQFIHLGPEVAYWQSPILASCQGNIRELHILCRAVPEVHKKKKSIPWPQPWLVVLKLRLLFLQPHNPLARHLSDGRFFCIPLSRGNPIALLFLDSAPRCQSSRPPPALRMC